MSPFLIPLFDALLGDSSVGIAQIRPSTVLQHFADRPDIYLALPYFRGMYGSNIFVGDLRPSQEYVRGYLQNPSTAIDILACEIRSQAVKAGVSLNSWYSGSPQERAEMIARFVSAKDRDSLEKITAFGTGLGINSFEDIKARTLLGNRIYMTIDPIQVQAR